MPRIAPCPPRSSASRRRRTQAASSTFQKSGAVQPSPRRSRAKAPFRAPACFPPPRGSGPPRAQRASSCSAACAPLCPGDADVTLKRPSSKTGWPLERQPAIRPSCARHWISKSSKGSGARPGRGAGPNPPASGWCGLVPALAAEIGRQIHVGLSPGRLDMNVRRNGRPASNTNPRRAR